MKKRWITMVLPIIALCLEILFKGAVLHYASPYEKITEYYSYFSLIPYGYANFGPLITAVLTCVLIVLSVVFFISGAAVLSKILMGVSIAAVITSMLPLLYGADYVTVVGILISVCMVIEMILSIFFSYRWKAK